MSEVCVTGSVREQNKTDTRGSYWRTFFHSVQRFNLGDLSGIQLLSVQLSVVIGVTIPQMVGTVWTVPCADHVDMPREGGPDMALAASAERKLAE